VVAEHDHFLSGLAVAAGLQDVQPAAFAQEQVHDGQVPVGVVAGQPFTAFVLGFGNAHRLHQRQLLQGFDQVLADGGTVFNDIGSELHGFLLPGPPGGRAKG
jgi:hypothetical protein